MTKVIRNIRADLFVKNKKPVEDVVDTKEEKVDTKLTVKELKKICKEKGLTGYSKLKEEELIALINSSEDK